MDGKDVVLPLDPVLKRLLDELPAGDPDIGDDDRYAHVWIPFCQGRHRIPVGQRVKVNFGEWWGPPMALTDVLVHASYKGRSGSERFLNLDEEVEHTGIVVVGDILVVECLVSPKDWGDT